MPKKKTPDEDAININKRFLKSYFREAIKNEEFLWPDDAVKKFMLYIFKVIEVENIDLIEIERQHPRLNPIAQIKELHHFAVDIFYETYTEQKAGAPSINDAHLVYLLMLQEQGLTYLEIAKEIGLPTNTKQERESSKGIVQKRIASAKKRTLKK